MQIYQEGHNLIVRDTAHFDLLTTLDCGQFFRFDAGSDGIITFYTQDKRYKAAQCGNTVTFYQTNDAGFLTTFFDLERDYAKIQYDFSCVDSIISKACKVGSGIRILKQDPFEMILSFLLSSNNNIARIKQIIEKLCALFGEMKEDAFGTYFAFPTAKRLASLSVDDLSPVRCGYRAKYIIEAAKDIATGKVSLAEIDRLPYEEAKAILTGMLGIGEKVANCILLFGFQKLSAFPVDVWIRKTIDLLYDGKLDPAIFGEYAGIAQQYLFYYVRSAKML